MKKVECQREMVKNNLALPRCPVCEQPMERVEGNSIICGNNHRFDFNRHGYLYFLNGTANTEYDCSTFESRRQLLNVGLFKPIIENVSKFLPSKSSGILDVGTGGGAPLLQLEAIRTNCSNTMIGSDISKPGIALATRLPLRAFFCATDLHKLPFNDESSDCILELFSPSDYQEFKRVLTKGGTLVKIIPNTNYLIELRHLLYETGERNYHYDNSRVIELFNQHYPHSKVEAVTYQFRISDGLQQAMLEMTPLHWEANARRLSKEELTQLKTITMGVSLSIAEKAS